MEWTEAIGTTQPLPNHSARISAAVEGHVLTVLRDEHGGTVVEGQEVKAGQVVVQLDDSVLQANRTKLEATLRDLRARRSVRPEERPWQARSFDSFSRSAARPPS